MIKRSATVLVVGLFSLVLAGCGKSGMHIWGNVTYEGKPVDLGTIYFTPEEGTTGPSTGGDIVDGKFDINEKGGPKPNGVYKVAITGLKKTGKMVKAFKSEDNKMVPEMASLIPPEYNTTSTLKVTISSDSTKNQFDFNLPVKK